MPPKQARDTRARSIGFCVAHPSFFIDSVVLSMSATAGQFCIYTTIKEFGAVVFAACMNVRQVTNITVSLLYYGHMISSGQFVGLVLVFGFLFYKARRVVSSKLSETHIMHDFNVCFATTA